MVFTYLLPNPIFVGYIVKDDFKKRFKRGHSHTLVDDEQCGGRHKGAGLKTSRWWNLESLVDWRGVDICIMHERCT